MKHTTDAELIRNTRKKLGLTQFELAVRAGLHEQTIYHIESQRYLGRKQTRIKIFNALIKELDRQRRN